MALWKLENFSKYALQYLSVFVATLVVLSDGMQFGWPSPAIPKLLQNASTVVITKNETKWITQSYLIGNIAGVILSVCIFNNMSRKLSIFVSGIPILLGWIGNLAATTLSFLCIARFIGGIGRNMAYVALPMYIGEVSDPKIRGILGSFMYFSMNIGVFTVYAITPHFDLKVPAIVGISIITVQMCLVKFIPESPYYLLMKQNVTEAEKSLKTLRSTNDVNEEIKRISEALQHQREDIRQSLVKKLILLFTRKAHLKALSIILVLRAIQMFSGISVMTMHFHAMFQQAGGNLPPELSAMIYAFILILSSLFSASIVDKFGRKSLMVFSGSFTALILTSQGAYFFFKTYDYNMSPISWLPLFNIIVFVLVYRIGLGTVPIVMVSEIFPTDVKVAGVVLSDLMYSLSSLGSNIVFEYTEDSFGIYTPLWIFAGCCALGAVVSMVIVPETRGITLEEIQHLIMNKKNCDSVTNEKSVTAV